MGAAESAPRTSVAAAREEGREEKGDGEGDEEEIQPRHGLAQRLSCCECFWGLSAEELLFAREHFELLSKSAVAGGFRVNEREIATMMAQPSSASNSKVCDSADCIFRITSQKRKEMGRFVEADGFQVLSTLCGFSCMDIAAKLEFLFDLFDFQKRGSMNYEELYLAIDTFSAGLEQIGGLSVPSTEELESILDCLFEALPDDSRELGRLSRRRFSRSSGCLRLFKHMTALENMLGARGADFHAEALRRSEKVDSLKPSPQKSFCLGMPVFASGCDRAFFLSDGALVVVVAGALALYPSGQGSTAVVLDELPALSWFHEQNITAVDYCWETDTFVTTDGSVVIVWQYDNSSLEPLLRLQLPDPSGFCTVLGWNGAAQILLCSLSWGSVIAFRIDLDSPRVLSKTVFATPSDVVQAALVLGENEFVLSGRLCYVEFFNVEEHRRRKGFLDPARLPNRSVFEAPGLISLAFHKRSRLVVAGTSSGHLMVFNHIKLLRVEEAHLKQPVVALQACSRGFASGGSQDGQIKLWSRNATLVASLTGLQEVSSVNQGIRSICWSNDGLRMAVATQAHELFQLSGISGSNLSPNTSAPFCSGHLGATATHMVPGANLFFTVGADATLRMWSLSSGRLVSTCMLEHAVDDVTSSLNGPPMGLFKVACRVAGRNALVVMERDTQNQTWRQVFEWTQAESPNPSFPGCMALSPCGRFLAADDLIFDLKSGTLHGNCPKIADSPSAKIHFTSAKQGHWRLHVGDSEAFDLVMGGVFQKRGVKAVKERVLAKLRDKEDEDREKREVDFTPAAVGDLLLDQTSGAVLGFKGAAQEITPDLPQSLCPVVRTPFLVAESAKTSVRAVQGCKGPWNASVESEEEFVVYSAFDVLVVVLNDGPRFMLDMFAQVVSLTCVQASKDEAGHKLYYIGASDGQFVCVWKLRLGAGPATIALHVRFRLSEARISELQLCSGSRHELFCLVTTNERQGHVVQVDEFPCVVHASFVLQTTDRQPPETQKHMFTGNGHRTLAVMEMASDRQVLVECTLGTQELVWHVICGRTVEHFARTHDCVVTSVDGDWLGDIRGSLWKLPRRLQQNDASVGLEMLCKNAHDSGPVVALRDRTSLSKSNVVRVWSDNGTVLFLVEVNKLSPSEGLASANTKATAICRHAVVLDGHRVSRMQERQASLTSSHTRIHALAFGFQHEGSKARGLSCTIGADDATVSLWSAEFALLQEVRMNVVDEAVTCTCAAFSYVGDLLAVGTSKGMVHILRVADLSKEVALLPCGGEANPVRSVAFSPCPLDDRENERHRFGAACHDGTIVFFDNAFKQIRKPIRGLSKLSKPVRELQFALDCEITRCVDEAGNAVYADSVSANHIPEEHLENTWISPPDSDVVQVFGSVLKHRASAKVPRTAFGPGTRGRTATSNPSSLVPTRTKHVFGMHQKASRAFNARGELVYAAGNGIVALDVLQDKQRMVFGSLDPHLVSVACFTVDVRFAALAFDDGRVAIVDSVSGRLEKWWDCTAIAAEPSSQADTAPESLVPVQISLTAEQPFSVLVLAKRTGSIKVAPDQVDDGGGANVLILCEASSGLVVEHEMETFCDMMIVLGRDQVLCTSQSAKEAEVFEFGTGKLSRLGGFALQDPVAKQVDIVSSADGEDQRDACLEGEAADLVVLVAPGIIGDSHGRVHILSGWGPDVVCCLTPVLSRSTNDTGSMVAASARVLHAHATSVVAVGVAPRFAETGVMCTLEEAGTIKMWRKCKECLMCVQAPLSSGPASLAVHPSEMLVLVNDCELMLENQYSRDAFKPLRVLGHSKECTDFDILTVVGAADEAPRGTLFTVGQDANLCKWDLRSGSCTSRMALDDVALGVACSCDKLFLLLGSKPDTKLVVLDATHFDVMHEAKLPSRDVAEIFVPAQEKEDLVHMVDVKANKSFTMHVDTYAIKGPFPYQPGVQRKSKWSVAIRGNCVFVTEQ